MSVQEWLDGALMPVVTKEESWSLDELENILSEVIRRCYTFCFARDQGKVVCTLSGGIDSSFCLAKIRSESSLMDIHTFTVGKNSKHPDIKHAKTVSEHFKTHHHEIIPKEKDIAWAKGKLEKIRPTEKITDGDIAVFLVYWAISDAGFHISMAHDGIDELLGGYPEHRFYSQTKAEKKMYFQKLWNELIPRHLIPLEKSARYFGIKVLFPYLQPEVVEYVSHIPVNQRTGKKISKIPLRNIASQYLPREIIMRKKLGFCSALD